MTVAAGRQGTPAAPCGRAAAPPGRGQPCFARLGTAGAGAGKDLALQDRFSEDLPRLRRHRCECPDQRRRRAIPEAAKRRGRSRDERSEVAALPGRRQPPGLPSTLTTGGDSLMISSRSCRLLAVRASDCQHRPAPTAGLVDLDSSFSSD